MGYLVAPAADAVKNLTVNGSIDAAVTWAGLNNLYATFAYQTFTVSELSDVRVTVASRSGPNLTFANSNILLMKADGTVVATGQHNYIASALLEPGTYRVGLYQIPDGRGYAKGDFSIAVAMVPDDGPEWFAIPSGGTAALGGALTPGDRDHFSFVQGAGGQVTIRMEVVDGANLLNPGIDVIKVFDNDTAPTLLNTTTSAGVIEKTYFLAKGAYLIEAGGSYKVDQQYVRYNLSVGGFTAPPITPAQTSADSISSKYGMIDYRMTDQATTIEAESVEVSDDPTAQDPFSIVSNGQRISSTPLNAKFKSLIASGLSHAVAVERTIEHIPAGITYVLIGGAALYLMSPVVAAALGVGVAAQILGRKPFFSTAIEENMDAKAGILSDVLNKFKSSTNLDKIEDLANQSDEEFSNDVSGQDTPENVSLVTNLLQKFGFNTGRSQPDVSLWIKASDDTTVTTLQAGHIDKFFGTSVADKVRLNSSSIGYGASGNDELLGGAAGGNVLAGGAGNDKLSAFGTRNFLDGGSGDDVVTGSPGDDTLDGGAGNDQLDGGDGVDVMLLSGQPKQYSVASSGAVYLIVGPDGFEKITRFEAVRFGDGTQMSFANFKAAAQIEGQFVLASGGAQTAEVLPEVYSGPVAWLQFQLLGTSRGDLALGTGRNDFFNLLGGDDGVQAGAGDDVIDGGSGSNFLTGGTGRDDFFLDGRGGTVTWSTITDWQAGERLSVFGFKPGTSRLSWVDSDGATGYRGVTLHADLNGDGRIETSVTWTGLTRAGLPTPLELPDLLWFT